MHFYYWKDCKDFLKSRNCSIYAIFNFQDSLDSKHVSDISNTLFENSSAFLLQSKHGYSEEEKSLCDSNITVEFPNKNMSPLINYDVYVSIVLEKFSSMNFNEKLKKGEKFLIDLKPQSHLYSDVNNFESNEKNIFKKSVNPDIDIFSSLSSMFLELGDEIT